MAPLAVLVLAAFLRIAGLQHAGIRFDDESWYASDARLWHRCARVILDANVIGAMASGETHAVRARMDEVGVDFNDRYAKPCLGFTLLGALAMFVTGDRPVALFWVNALCGSASVLLLYLFASRFLSRGIALGAAALLAVSPQHVYYSRSALTESTTVFFILLGTWLWVRARQSAGRKLSWIAVGAAFGYAITCHYRAALFPILILGAELVPAFVRLIQATWHRLRTSAANCPMAVPQKYPFDSPPYGKTLIPPFMLALGLAIPPLIFEAGLRAARLIANSADGYFPMPTYFEALSTFANRLGPGLDSQASIVLTFTSLSEYTRLFAYQHGLFAAGLAAVGCLALTASKPFGRWVAIMLITTLVLLSVQRYTVARAISAILPFLLLASAAGIAALIRQVRVPPRLVAPVFASSFALLAWYPLRESHAHQVPRDGIAEASRIIMGQGARAVAVPLDAQKYALHLDSTVKVLALENLRNNLSPDEALTSLREKGIRWVILDAQPWHYRQVDPKDDKVFAWYADFEARLLEMGPPEKSLAHLSGFEWEFLAEGWGHAFLEDMRRRQGGRLRIYKLDHDDQAACDFAASKLRTSVTTARRSTGLVM